MSSQELRVICLKEVDMLDGGNSLYGVSELRRQAYWVDRNWVLYHPLVLAAAGVAKLRS